MEIHRGRYIQVNGFNSKLDEIDTNTATIKKLVKHQDTFYKEEQIM